MPLTCLVASPASGQTPAMFEPYKALTLSEKTAWIVAFLVALGCLAIVATTPIDGFHRAAQFTLALMLIVCSLIVWRNQRRRN